MVEYFEVDGMPGKYFTCMRYGTMAPASCARNYAEAPEKVKAGRLAGCIGCPIGRAHAGIDVPVMHPISRRETTAHLQACLRCRRSGRENTSRLIGRMRLVRSHTICVSCYNREREVVKGKNSKGATPIKWRGLYSTQISYATKAQVSTRIVLSVPVVDRIEAALVALRQFKVDGVFFAAPAIVRLP